MSVIKVNNIEKNFGSELIFTNVKFDINIGDKIGLIGANGTGKTTLMKCLLGQEEYDQGRISIPEGYTIGYVEQESKLGQLTLYEELKTAYKDILDLKDKIKEIEQNLATASHSDKQDELMNKYSHYMERFEAGGGYEFESMIRRVAHGLGFTSEDLTKNVNDFSGGQKTRISLAKALVRQPDFLFLDEPTNHLDIEMVEWLEEFLATYRGGMLIISHDRYFLDRVTTHTNELENYMITSYKGNYSSYAKQKAERVLTQLREYEKQQAYIEKTEEYIRRYKAGIKCKQARGRQLQLNRLARITAPEEQVVFDLEFLQASECAERVLELDKVQASYDAKVIFEKLSLLIRRGERVALVGPNGAGKTTLLKLIVGKLRPSRGSVKLGSRVKVSYFAQEHEQLQGSSSLLTDLMYEFGFNEERARSLLATVLFIGDDVLKIIDTLSGGEKARYALLKLVLEGSNFLVLDEPTNHLDILAKEAVEEAVLNFEGTFLAVSHDRYFLDTVADKIIELKDGELTTYAGNYSYYREKKRELQRELEERLKLETTNKPTKVVAITSQADVPSPKRANKENPKAIERLELEITELEVTKKMLEYQLNDPANHTDIEKSQKLAEEYEELKIKLQAKYDRWLENQ